MVALRYPRPLAAHTAVTAHLCFERYFMPRRPKTIHRFFIVFYIVGIGAISSIPFNIITTLFTQGPSALDPRVWQKIYLVQLARQYPIATSIIGLVALVSMNVGRQLQINYGREVVLSQPNNAGQAKLRQSMLSHVQHLVEGQSQETLHGEIMMTIRTRDLPEYVPAESRQFSQPYFADATGVFPSEPIVEGLAAGNQALLLLGEPGAGKTVALLLCAQALVARALRDADAPIPVLFNLSTWAPHIASR
jgi:hypothetical protein